MGEDNDEKRIMKHDTQVHAGFSLIHVELLRA